MYSPIAYLSLLGVYTLLWYLFSLPQKKKRNPAEVSFDGVHGTGNDLLSHNLEMYYHRRTLVSLPCSVWERVGPSF